MLAEWMAMFLRELPAGSLIAVDDVQFGYDDPNTTRFVAALVEATKDMVRWLIAVRSANELPLGEWLAQGDMEIPIDRVDLGLISCDPLAATRSRISSMLALGSGVPEVEVLQPGLTADEMPVA